MQQIKIPKTFFIKERDNLYSNWMTAFWREMLQNSIDAGSKTINIKIDDNDGHLSVAFQDDGCGMTRQVLDDVFFALGETTKTGSGTTGGFGRARILTCFAMESYKILTQDNTVKGDGAFYQVDETDYYDGCLFSIQVGKYSREKLVQSLENVLRMSQIDCTINVDFGDGSGPSRWTNWLYRRRMVKVASYGDIHVNKSGERLNQVIVRVNGLWMYSIYCNAKAQVVVEIDPTKSRDVLTVNRDGMHYQYSNDLQAFINELSVDTRSALKSNRRKTRLIHGVGSRYSANKNRQTEIVKTVEPGERAGNVGAVTAAFQMTAEKARSSTVVEHEVVDGQRIVDDLPHIYINDETDPYDSRHSKVRAVIDRFDPMNWTYCVRNSGGETTKYRKGSSYLKLLMIWETCCMYAIECLLDTNAPVDDVRWLIGWTFSFEEGACHVGLHEGHALCLNPVESDGTLAYKIRNKSDQVKLMALAKHEVAHIVESAHNEDYASILTDIDMRFDATECFRRIRKALAG